MHSVIDDWQVEAGEPLCRDPEVGTPSWQDSIGPLAIYRVGTASDRHYRLRLGNDIAIDLHSGRRLTASVRPGLDPDTLDHFLADQVIPRALAGEGKQVLHAGAVRRGAGGILLLGASGRGKSTLTTSFHLAGHTMLGDDAIIIDQADGVPVAQAVYPSLRLLPDSIAALMPSGVETGPVADYTPKRRVQIPLALAASGEAVPVAALVVIGPPAVSSGIEFRELSVADACMALVHNSFALDPADTACARRRLDQASTLARQVPSVEISYPRDYARLADVRAAILERLP